MKTLLLHFILGFILLKMALNQPARMPPTQSISWDKTLSSAYLLGQKKHLSYKLKKAHEKLHLQHLMTPSGLHLSALCLLLFALIKRRRYRFLIFSGLGLFFSAAALFPSLVRMAWFGAFKQLLPGRSRLCFILAFLLDYLSGSWERSPLSFALSFLFLGVILLTFEKGKKQLVLGLGYSQLMIAFVMGKVFYPVGFFFGFLFTSVFPFLFPFFVADFVAPWHMTGWYESLILFAAKLSILKIHVGLTLLILPLFFFKPRLIPLLALFYSPGLFNFPSYLQKRKAFHSPPPKNVIGKKTFTWGTLSTHPGGLKCHNRLYPDGWSTHCRL